MKNDPAPGRGRREAVSVPEAAELQYRLVDIRSLAGGAIARGTVGRGP